ncbi:MULTISPECIES: hypothetical protein [Microbacterium]|jgi:hypothetical protein|uniref:hypothetical protein n=1 Tax=Microbacterium TaxID=33882 RepID=UPI00095B4BF4|nr:MULTISPECIES: hypothetical protein [Microbacterium]MCC4268925.1 hypothetical protein [Microbacterium schleiferi]OJV93976.1 MAG: hypothetical protein BGO47_00680 [Microbacterium sp. 67-17]
MTPTTRTQRAAVLSERLLITRIVTALGLALLLMLGIAAAGHLETDGTTPVPLGMSALVDPHVEPLSGGATDARDGREQQTVVGESSGASALMGAALCVLGMLCGLVLAVLTYRLWRSRVLPDRGIWPRVLSLFPHPSTISRVSILSLTQLSISRT